MGLAYGLEGYQKQIVSLRFTVPHPKKQPCLVAMET